MRSYLLHILFVTLWFRKGTVAVENITLDQSTCNGIGYEIVQERLDHLQYRFLEMFVHVRELGETVLNNQRSLEERQLQTNNLVAHHQKLLTAQVDDLSFNVSLATAYSRQVLNLQSVCANHDLIRKSLERVKPEGGKNSATIESCSCAESKSSGLFRMKVPNSAGVTMSVFCELQRFGGHWLVIQQRFDGLENFTRSWSEYRDGFGVVGEEFWLGLEVVHRLTRSSPHELLVELEDFGGAYKYARYASFAVAGEDQQYKLLVVDGYSGTAGDSMEKHKGMKFTTIDRDYDTNPKNCAEITKGAWWFHQCHQSHLNGQHLDEKNWNAINWNSGWGNQGLKFTRMMIRRK
ncbi:hypothetical protein quinque_005057 [Culex quinquefasciatus]